MSRGVGAGSGRSGKTFEQLEREVAELRKLVKELIQPKSRARVVNVGSGGGGSRFYRLMEDVTGNGLFWAKRTDYANATPATDAAWTQVRNWDTLLNGALAGSRFKFDLTDGEWCVDAGNCVDGCTTAGTITVGDPPDGTVDAAYAGHTISSSGLATGPAASGLPAGLSISAGEITGTPTEAGTFYVTITGTAAATPSGTCTLTRIMVLVINEAA